MPAPAAPKDLRHWLREILILLAINFVIASLMYLLDDSTSWPVKLIYANAVGGCIWGLTQLGHLAARQRLPVWLIQLLAVPPGLYLGLKIAAVLGSPDVFQFMQQNPDIGWRSLILPLVVAIIAASFVLVRYQGQVYRAELERERRLLAEYRQADTQAQLMFLQAQIEPHFLFNTLANVHSLIMFNPQQAQTMLTHFNGYLRASLQRTRRPLSTLQHELELIEKLLEIARIRLGDRLSFCIDIAPELHGKLLPPLLLQPLVENALAHGIEPSLHKGHIRVHAELHDEQLCLKVTDDGVGLEAQTLQSTSGIGLANVRNRLHHLYGDKARLALFDNPPHGCISELCLPLAALDTPPAVLLQEAPPAEPSFPVPPLTKSNSCMPTALIADDEPLLLNYLCDRLRHLWPELELVATARNGVEALSLVHQHKPDFAFLDIRMPGLNGLQVAESLHQTRAVFVTAFDEYAVAAFERAAADYLLKPVSDERLKKCIDRLRQQLQPDPALLTKCLASLQTQHNKLHWFHVGLANQTRLVALDEVLFFQASDKYTELVTAHERHVIRTPLKELIRQLDSQWYAQVHRSYIVSLRAVAYVEKDLFGRHQIHLKEHADVLPLSRTFAAQFKQM